MVRERREYFAARRARLKRAVHAAYGAQCRHCGEKDPHVLALDHIHDDGHLAKKPSGQRRSSSETYRLAARDGYPVDRYQLLCHNCNYRKELNRRRAKREQGATPSGRRRAARGMRTSP